jgi:photosystem II stability/assembly factor-like uncharacterized protein
MTKTVNFRFLLLFIACTVFFSILIICCSDSPTESIRPSLVLSDRAFDVSGAVDISGPPDQLVEITSNNGGMMAYSAVLKSTGTRTNPWLRLLNETGFTPDTMVLRFSIGSTDAGTFVDTILVTAADAANSPQMIEVRLTMRSVLTVSQAYLRVIALANADEIDSQTVRIESNGNESFSFTAETNRDWISVSHPQGTGPVTLTIYTDAAGLPQGLDTARIVITAPDLYDSPKLITVYLDVAAWAPQEAPLKQDLDGVYFLDENTGWAVGRIASISEITGYIVRTTDGGKNWELMSIEPRQALGYIEFVSPTVAWIVGGRGLVLKTTNGGASWETQHTPAVDDSLDLWNGDFYDLDRGWAVGVNGAIVATTDGGVHWDYQESHTDYALSGISFLDAQTGWIVGNHGTILHTTDGGQTWNPQNSTTTIDLNGVIAIDQNTVWIVGRNGTILYTTDGGANWINKPSPTLAVLQTVFFIDNNQGWITGNDGVMLYTSDGGTSWTKQRTGTGNWLHDVFFLNDKVGWAVGELGIIVHTISGGN